MSFALTASRIVCTARFALVALLSLLASACGGGGGDGTGGSIRPPGFGSNPQPPFIGTPSICTSGQTISAAADLTGRVGKAAGAVIAGCTGALSNPVWTQTAGPAVSLLSDKTQAISFEPASAGVYEFSVSFRDSVGTARSQNVIINVADAPTTSTVTARVDQAVRAGGPVSVRAWPKLVSGDAVSLITWQQTEGPAVTLDTSDPSAILFTAPAVTADTLLRFRVTMRTTRGAIDTDDVLVLVENYRQAPADPNGTGPYIFSDTFVSRVYPYRANGPYATALVRCTFEANLQYTGAGSNLCPLSTLPLLHQDTNGGLPTTEQIMNRVLVSHDWMGANFEAFLNSPDASADLKRLFNSVTAIVIGSHVRPSYYYVLTGAIYLDADNFWLTAAQRDTINEAPDFRSNFGADLNYGTLWRYTSGNTNIFSACVPLADRSARSPSCLLADGSWLLYHELAHASDFLPPGMRGSLNNALSVPGNVSQVASDALPPLNSVVLKDLAKVKFLGVSASPAQRQYTPGFIALEFAPDSANDDYNYSNPREHIAMLFEEFMQQKNHGFRRDFAITDKIVAGSTGNSIIVRWGQRGRVGDPNVRPSVRQAVQALAPWVDLATVDTLPAPIAMRAGDSWNGNLALPAPLGSVSIQSARGAALPPELDSLLLSRALQREGRRPGTQGSGASINERWLQRQATRAVTQ